MGQFYNIFDATIPDLDSTLYIVYVNILGTRVGTLDKRNKIRSNAGLASGAALAAAAESIASPYSPLFIRVLAFL